LDTDRQVTTPVHEVFGRNDRSLPIPAGIIDEIIAFLLSKHKTPGYLRDRLGCVQEIATLLKNEPDEGINLAASNPEGL
jgi:hypothetical protein